MLQSLAPRYAACSRRPAGRFESQGGAMKRRWSGSAAAAAALVLMTGCESLQVDVPGAPRDVTASYYAGAVTVSWELAPDWDGETFRIYAKRSTDAQYYLVAEVTSCAQGFCSYTDANVEPGRSYD